MSSEGGSVEFYFDPMCPWAYQASVWIRDVRERTGSEITWRFFSLEEINRAEGKKHPWEREWSFGWSQMRVAAMLRRRDPALVDRWYEAQGKAFFEDGRPTFLREGAKEICAELGVDPSIVDDAIDDPTTTDDVKADHDGVVSEHGAFGVPTLVFPEGRAVFGPVITPGPRGDEAIALWELVLSWRRFPRLYEMRTPKTADDFAHIASDFETYARARRWQTVQNPAP